MKRVIFKQPGVIMKEHFEAIEEFNVDGASNLYKEPQIDGSIFTPEKSQAKSQFFH